MTLDTHMTPALLQELLMALRANDADGYKSWLALGIEDLQGLVAVGGDDSIESMNEYPLDSLIFQVADVPMF